MNSFQRIAFASGLLLLFHSGCSKDVDNTSVPDSDNRVPAASNSGSESATEGMTFLDLQPQGNTSQLAMTGIEPGTRRMGGVQVKIGRELVHVGGSAYPDFPAQVNGIPVNRTFQMAHFLHATQGGSFQRPGHAQHEADGTPVGRYVLHYSDGSTIDVPLVYGEDLRGWWNWDSRKSAKRVEIVWEGDNKNAKRNGVNVRLYMLHWVNPQPEKTVTHLDVISDGAKAAPFCVAITLTDKLVGNSAVAPPTPPVAATPVKPTPSEQFQAAKARTDWLNRVSEIEKQYQTTFRESAGRLQQAMLDHAQLASKAGRKDDKNRLYEERNKMAGGDVLLPASPEVRDEALAYADERLLVSKSLLQELARLRENTPEQANEIDRAKLDKLQTTISDDVARYGVAREQVAALPRSTSDNKVAKVGPDKPRINPVPEPASPGSTPKSIPPVDSGEKREFLGPAPAKWQVDVDPPTAKVEWPDSLNYQLTADPMRVVHPRGPSRFIVVGDRTGHFNAVTLYDLGTGKAIGGGSGFHEGDVEVSPDGTWLAFHHISDKIMVGNLKTKKPVAQIDRENVDFILFPRADQILGMDTETVQLWQLPSGKPIRSFPVAEEKISHPRCSPGGRYLAFAGPDTNASSVIVYDLQTGLKAGEFQTAGQGNAVKPTIQGLAFSHDGREIAAFVSGFKTGAFSIGEAMQVWDTATGRLVYLRVLDRGPGRGALTIGCPQPLQWFPDGKGWVLFQRYIVDRKAAAVVADTNFKSVTSGHRAVTVLDNERVLQPNTGNILTPTKVQRVK